MDQFIRDKKVVIFVLICVLGLLSIFLFGRSTKNLEDFVDINNVESVTIIFSPANDDTSNRKIITSKTDLNPSITEDLVSTDVVGLMKNMSQYFDEISIPFTAYVFDISEPLPVGEYGVFNIMFATKGAWINLVFSSDGEGKMLFSDRKEISYIQIKFNRDEMKNFVDFFQSL